MSLHEEYPIETEESFFWFFKILFIFWSQRYAFILFCCESRVETNENGR